MKSKVKPEIKKVKELEPKPEKKPIRTPPPSTRQTGPQKTLEDAPMPCEEQAP